MALGTLQTIAQIQQKARIDSARSAAVAKCLRALYSHFESFKDVGLIYKPFSTSGAVDVVLSDSPCKLYALMFKKRAGSTTASWLKVSNHATVVALSGELVIALDATAAALKAQCPIYPDGLPFGIGFSIASHTTTGGTTDSAAADSVDGFALLGAP